jgi:excinuclease UvrABC ATPase subunit
MHASDDEGVEVHEPTTPAERPPYYLRDLARLRRVRDRIDREYAQPLDVEALARGAHMSAGHLSRQFRRAYGTVRIFTESGFLDPNKPIRDCTETELHDFLHREPTKVKVNGVDLTYEGLIPRVQKLFLSKDREALQPHIRAFVDRAVTFTTCPECGGSRLNEAARASRIRGINIADACAMQISDLAENAVSLHGCGIYRSSLCPTGASSVGVAR